MQGALKGTLAERLEDRADLLRDVRAAVFEDVALAPAIREGEEVEELQSISQLEKLSGSAACFRMRVGIPDRDTH